MLKKIVTYIFYTFIIAAFSAYFYFASYLKKEGDKINKCSSINVVVLDSMENRFVSKAEVKDLITNSKFKPIGKNIQELNINDMESFLDKKSAIKKTNVSINRSGVLNISIKQRRPVLRINTVGGGFYIDDSKYVFPLSNTFTSYVLVVTGKVPIKLKTGERGLVSGKDQMWVNKMFELCDFLEKNLFWKTQIQQIHFEENGEISMFTKVGDQTIKFGSLDNFEYKFQKLTSFYKNIIPITGWEKYSEVNVKYTDQIICTKR